MAPRIWHRSDAPRTSQFRLRKSAPCPIYIYNTFEDPSAFTGTTQALGVNDTDQIVGIYTNASGDDLSPALTGTPTHRLD